MKIPEGSYEITLDGTGCYNLEPIDKVKQWEDLGEISGCRTSESSQLMQLRAFKCGKNDRNIFKTVEQAKASIAVAQLTQLLAEFNGDWVADWENNNVHKHVILNSEEGLIVAYFMDTSSILAFPTAERAELFLKHHEAKIKEAAPILFGVEL